MSDAYDYIRQNPDIKEMARKLNKKDERIDQLERAQNTSNRLTDTRVSRSRSTTPSFASGASAALLDEDDMASDSATQGATQQSIKAYADALDTDDIAEATNLYFTDARAVDAIEAIGTSTPVAGDWMIFSDAGVLKRVLLSGLDENILTAIKSYVDGQNHLTTAEAIDAVEAVGLATPVSTDWMIFSDAGVLKKVALSSLDENILTAIKSYVDGAVSTYGDSDAVDAIEAVSAGVAVLADTVPFIDATDGVLKQESLSDINAILDHDALLNFASNEHFTEASIDHTSIQNIGSNTHAQIDTHISNEPAAAIATHAAITTAHHTKYTNAEAVDAVEAVGFGTPVSSDELVYVDSGVLQRVNFSAVDEDMLTGIKSYVDALTMVGSGNAEWIELAFNGGNVASASALYRWGDAWLNQTGTDDAISAMLAGIPLTLGSLNLYISGVRLEIYTADSNDYVDRIRLFAVDYNSSNNFYDYTTNLTSAQSFTDTFTAQSMSGYTNLLMYINYVSTSTDQLKINTFAVQCYYA